MQNLSEYLDRLGIRIFLAQNAYGFWKAIKQNIDIVIGKDRAEKNIQILNRYQLFFRTVQHSLETTFIIELYKFFDKRKDVLKLVDDNSYEVGLAKTTISDKGKQKIKNIIKENKFTIDQIKKLRKELFAHDKKDKNILIIPPSNELDTLFNGVREICRIISKETDLKIGKWPDISGEKKNKLFVRLIMDLEK